MRNIIKLSALVCALILVLSLCACSKKPEEPAEPPATAEGGMPEITQNNDDTGDRLARVVSVYKIENGGWNGASAEDISENDYLVVTKNDGGVLKWLTVIR